MPDQFAVSSVGDNVTLTCTPGDTSVSIDWYRGDQLLTGSSKYIFFPTIQHHMLTITDVQLNDANCYYCTLAGSETRDDLKIELIVVEGIHMNIITTAWVQICRIWQNIRGGKLSCLAWKMVLHWKTFTLACL